MPEVSTIDLRELAAALKHDLGKYVAWRSANFEETAWVGELDRGLVEALQADILSTRGDAPAWAVWERHTSGLARPFAEPELEAVDRAVASLRGCEDALRSGDAARIAAAGPTIRDAQRVIREELRALHRRALGGR